MRSSDSRRDRRARSSDDRAARRSTSALAISIDEGRDRPMSALVRRSRRLSIAVLFLLARRTIARRTIAPALSSSSLSLSDLGSLFSLSLSLFPEMI